MANARGWMARGTMVVGKAAKETEKENSQDLMDTGTKVDISTTSNMAKAKRRMKLETTPRPHGRTARNTVEVFSEMPKDQNA